MAQEKRQKVTTPEFRASFADVFSPSSFSGGDPKFSITMLFDKKTDLTKLKAMARDAAKERWGDKLPANLRNPFHDGSEKEHLDGYGPDVIFVRASTKTRPGIVDAQRNNIVSAEEFYAGCWARATLTVFCYDNNGNKGVSFGLLNLQKLRDGESFSARVPADEDFDSVDASAWDDDEGNSPPVDAKADTSFLD